MENHYFTTKLVKMGKWALLPLDTDNWFSDDSSPFFNERFGIWKGVLIVCDITTLYQHVYIPISYFETLYTRIKSITDADYKGLEKILKEFYPLKKEVRAIVPKYTLEDLSAVSNVELERIYAESRRNAHRITVYDQFGWLAEDYWKPLMEKVLVGKLKIEKDSPEYHRVLFTLTTPEEISTTLEEKRAVLKAALAVQKDPESLKEECQKLSEEFGWMPVFAYGEPWNAAHYEEEVSKVAEKETSFLETEYRSLTEYSLLRNKNIADIVAKYSIDEKDLQIFVDFGLALDGRNEAEYAVSFCTYHLLPIYAEITKRFGITIGELRTLYGREIKACLLGAENIRDVLHRRGAFRAIGYDESMEHKFYFDPRESEKLFRHAESYVQNVQGNTEHEGVCASSGTAKGIARIVATPKDNYKVQDGDILITHATTVDYLPAMKKAAAIVTEVGGLTCHAAVVSREFKIPCVVALKDAMTNFKDGELIEVNADKGLVTVVKK